MRLTSLSIILERKEYMAKMNNLPKHHGAGPEARVSMQLHRLHLLKGGSAVDLLTHRSSISRYLIAVYRIFHAIYCFSLLSHILFICVQV